MKIVGAKNRTEIERDPQRAWERGKALDAMLRGTLPPHPRGVWRLTHEEMNEMDQARQLALASRLNKR